MKALVVLVLLVVNTVFGQTAGNPLKDNGIYLTAKDYQAGILAHGFDRSKDMKILDKKRLFIIIKSADSSYLFYYDQIWGYRKDGIDWRVFNESAYQVENTRKICIYSVPVCVSCLTTPPCYFSFDLNSPLHPLKKNELIAAYHTNTGFIEKIRKLSWTTSIMKRNKKTHQFIFIDWL